MGILIPIAWLVSRWGFLSLRYERTGFAKCGFGGILCGATNLGGITIFGSKSIDFGLQPEVKNRHIESQNTCICHAGAVRLGIRSVGQPLPVLAESRNRISNS
jgi:hypothetical protein